MVLIAGNQQERVPTDIDVVTAGRDASTGDFSLAIDPERAGQSHGRTASNQCIQVYARAAVLPEKRGRELARAHSFRGAYDLSCGVDAFRLAAWITIQSAEIANISVLPQNGVGQLIARQPRYPDHLCWMYLRDWVIECGRQREISPPASDRVQIKHFLPIPKKSMQETVPDGCHPAYDLARSVHAVEKRPYWVGAAKIGQMCHLAVLPNERI